MTIRTLLCLLISFTTITVSAQDSTLAVVSRSKHNAVWLRWAPTDAALWQVGNQHGYTIERFTLLPNGELSDEGGTNLTPTPLKPLTPAEFLPLSERSDEVATLEELLYGEDATLDLSRSGLADILERHEALENRFGIAMLMCDLSRDAAKAAGLFFEDTNVKSGQRYIYRIKLAAPDGSAAAQGVAVISHSAEEALPSLSDLSVEFGDRTAALKWPTFLFHGVYTAFHIERSTDGKKFERLTDLPYIHLSEKVDVEDAVYVDSLESNHRTYYYRIQGITPFAELGPYSNVVRGEGKENLFGLLILREVKLKQENTFELRWEFPAEFESAIEGFAVARAPSPEGPYNDITRKPMSKKARTYSDVTPYNNTYYIIRALDKQGHERTRSFPYLVQIADDTPPAIPGENHGEIDSTGTVVLQWKANADADLLGYRVFRSNSPSDDPIEVTTRILSENTFLDTVKVRVLNREVYYRVVAVDQNYNTSEYSARIVLHRPDIIPPVAPVITQTEMRKDSLVVSWINSTSIDVMRTELHRDELSTRTRRILRSWTTSAPITSHEDVGLTAGHKYRYTVIAFDSAGNTSQASTRVITYEPGLQQSAGHLVATVDRKERKITLRWKNVAAATKCVVYRAINDSPLTIYKTVEGDVESFIDEGIHINNRYRYAVQPIYPRGRRALLSKEIEIVF